jgi:hypothetical protein
MDDMGWLVLFIQLVCSFWVPVEFHLKPGESSKYGNLRSPSDELAKIQVSFGSFPYFEPTGSVSIIYCMAFPTSPVPPVTRTTAAAITQCLAEKQRSRRARKYGPSRQDQISCSNLNVDIMMGSYYGSSGWVLGKVLTRE